MFHRIRTTKAWTICLQLAALAALVCAVGCGAETNGSTAANDVGGVGDGSGLADGAAADDVAVADDVEGSDGAAATDVGVTDVLSDGEADDVALADGQADGALEDAADAAELDTLADSAADAADVDTAPAAFAVALTAPYAGQTFALGDPIAAKVHVSGSAAQIATSALIWSLADSDGGNVTSVAGAPAIPGADGNASASLSGLAAGVRSLTVKVDAGGTDVASASAAIVVCPAKGAVLNVAGEAPQEAMLAAGSPVVIKASVDGVVGPGAELEVVSDFDGVLGKVAIAPTAGVATTDVQLTITPLTNG